MKLHVSLPFGRQERGSRPGVVALLGLVRIVARPACGGPLADEAPTFPVGRGPGFVVQRHVTVPGYPGRSGKPNLNSEFGGGFTSVERGWNLRWRTLELRRYPALSGYVYTELYDIEHEMAGILTFGREPNDSGGNDPSASNADTVLISDPVPLAPGSDRSRPPFGGQGPS